MKFVKFIEELGVYEKFRIIVEYTDLGYIPKEVDNGVVIYDDRQED